MSKTKNEVGLVKKQEVGLMTPGAPQRGFEVSFNQNDYVIPRAKLIQALSPEMNEGLEGVKIGSIINSLTKEILPMEFIPVFAFKNFTRFNPRSKDDPNFDPNFEPGAMIWTSVDPYDPRVLKQTKFGPNGEKPAATTFLNFFSYFPGSPMPIIISFSKSSYKSGKQLLSLAKFSRGDMFSKKYELTSAVESNSIGTYSVLKVAALGDSSPEEFAICEKLWKDFAGSVQDIRMDSEEEVADESVQGKRPY